MESLPNKYENATNCFFSEIIDDKIVFLVLVKYNQWKFRFEFDILKFLEHQVTKSLFSLYTNLDIKLFIECFQNVNLIDSVTMKYHSSDHKILR